MFRAEHKDRASIKGYIPAILSWPLTICSSVASWARSGVFVFIHIFLLWVYLMTLWTQDNFCPPQLPMAMSSTASVCSVWESISFCFSGKCHLLSLHSRSGETRESSLPVLFWCPLLLTYNPGTAMHPGSMEPPAFVQIDCPGRALDTVLKNNFSLRSEAYPDKKARHHSFSSWN